MAELGLVVAQGPAKLKSVVGMTNDRALDLPDAVRDVSWRVVARQSRAAYCDAQRAPVEFNPQRWPPSDQPERANERPALRVNAFYSGDDVAFYAVDKFQIRPELRIDGGGVRYQRQPIDAMIRRPGSTVDLDGNPNTLSPTPSGAGPTSDRDLQGFELIFPQRFASVHADVHDHFALERHSIDRQTCKERRSAALAERQVLAS